MHESNISMKIEEEMKRKKPFFFFCLKLAKFDLSERNKKVGGGFEMIHLFFFF